MIVLTGFPPSRNDTLPDQIVIPAKAGIQGYYTEFMKGYSQLNLIVIKRIKMDFFLCVLGMVMVVEGIPYFAFPDKMKVWVRKVLEIPDLQLRRTGLILMGLGLFLVFLGKR